MNTSELVKELAHTFFDYMLRVDSQFQKAYFRFFSNDELSRANGSYQEKTGDVKLFDQLKNQEAFAEMITKANQLICLVDKGDSDFCLILLTIHSTFEYEIKFEFLNPEKWLITKMNGGTGLPI